MDFSRAFSPEMIFKHEKKVIKGGTELIMFPKFFGKEWLAFSPMLSTIV